MRLLPLGQSSSSTSGTGVEGISSRQHCFPATEQKIYLMSDNSVSSAIFLACERGALSALRQLVSGCRVQLANLVNELGESPLHVASGNGFAELVTFLLDRGCDPGAEDGRGDTPLVWAARNGHCQLFKQLLRSPAQANARNKNGETALHVAARYAQYQAVLALLEAGADAQLEDTHGETALHIAAWDGQSGLLDLLCRFSQQLNSQNLASF